jgi:hypothetical protein
MFGRPALVIVLACVIAGCATNYTGISDGESVLDTLRAEKKGLVLIHTSLNDQRCAQVLATVAHPDASGRHVGGEEIALKRILNRANAPIEVHLPAGDYGIVGLECRAGNVLRTFGMRATERGNILTGEGAIYDHPIATFSVHAGEFVDVGSLQLPLRSTGTFFQPGEFSAYVVPNGETVVQELAAKKPLVYAHLVRRLMVTPGRAQPPGPIASPLAAH